MNENKILDEFVLPYLESLGYQKSSITHNLPIEGVKDIKVGDLMVYNNGQPYFIVEAKAHIPEKNDQELLKFHPYVRKLQSQASALNAPYYLLTDGHAFLWFKTDTVGRPMLLDKPVTPTSERGYRLEQYSKETAIRILRNLQDYLLIRSGSTQSKELSALFIMAKLLSERGDKWLKEQLLHRKDIQVDPTGLSFLNLFDYSYWERVNLDQVFKILDEISFSSVPSNDLLSALDDVLMDHRSRFNELRIARWLADLLVHLGQVRAQSNDIIIDIACGSGDILAAISLNLKEVPAWGISSSAESTLWSQLQLVALDRRRESILRGRIPPFDVLRSQRLPAPTHIITAPQFGVRVNQNDSSYLYDVRSQLYSEGVRQMEDIYLELAINWVLSNGRIVMLVPEGMLFSRDRRQATRKFILDNTRITAIISLDSGALLPYSAIKTSILVLDKESSQNNYDVFMARINGNTTGDTFQSSEVAQVSEVLKRFERWTRYKQIEPDSFGWIVPASKLSETWS